MGGNCPEYFDKQKFLLYQSVISFKKQHHKEYSSILSSANEANVITFKSRREAELYLKCRI